MLRITLVISLFFYITAAKHEQYEGHVLYDVFAKSVDHMEYLKDAEAKYNLDVWRYSYHIPSVVLVPKHLKETFQRDLQDFGIEFKIAVENIKELLDLEDSLLKAASSKSNSSRARSVVEGLSFDRIHTFEEVDQYLVDLANAFPETVSVASAGRSFEGRDIKYLKISSTNFQNRNKPIIMIQSLLHSREWVTLPVALYAIHKLVIDVTEQNLVQDIDWIIMPVANPDGYVFSHNGDRFWRKNRATGFMAGDFCMGVDLNRNFDIFWGTASSPNVCTETFHGRGPFSEPETAAIRDIFAEYGNRMEVYIDLHSFGSLILYAYGNGDLPPNALAKNLVAVRMAQAIDAVKWPENRDYVVGNIVHLLYFASGGSSDYATAVGTPYSYSFELPATNNVPIGFLVDPAFIEQAGYETWEAFKEAGRLAISNWSRRAGN